MFKASPCLSSTQLHQDPNLYMQVPVLAISEQTNNMLWYHVQELSDLPSATTTAAKSTPATSAKALQKQYTALYEKLLSYGFQQQHAQEVLKALPRGTADLESCLDWLCMNVPRGELPRRFAGGVRAGGGAGGSKIKVRWGLRLSDCYGALVLSLG